MNQILEEGLAKIHSCRNGLEQMKAALNRLIEDKTNIIDGIAASIQQGKLDITHEQINILTDNRTLQLFESIVQQTTAKLQFIQIVQIPTPQPPSPTVQNAPVEPKPEGQPTTQQKKQPINYSRVSFDLKPPTQLKQLKLRITAELQQFSASRSQLSNGICELFKTPSLDKLRYLALQSNKIDSEGLKILSDIKLPSLTYLYLANNLIKQPVFVQDNWPALKYLSLTNNGITSQKLVCFGKYFPQLEYLCLKLNPIGDTGLTKILSDDLSRLLYLHLESTKLTSVAKFEVVGGEPPKLKSLQSIYLGGNQIRGQALKNLLGSILIQKILILKLDQNKLKKQDIDYLVQNQSKFPSLTSLDLSSNELTGGDLDSLLKLKLNKLDHLYLKNNRLDTINYLGLLAKAQLPQLRSVQIDGNKFEPSKEYIVKGLMEKFHSVTESKRYKKIHIHA